MTTDTIATRQGWAPLVATGLASALVQFDIAAVVIAMPQVQRDFGLDRAGFAWIMDGYSLVFAGLLVAAGACADRFGQRPVMLWGLGLFALASLGCGLAPDLAWLIAMRAAQGLGAALITCAGLALIGRLHPDPAARRRAFGIVGTLVGAAMALGPAGGGLIAELAGWRTIFLINLPICAALLVMLPLTVGSTPGRPDRPLDLATTALLTAGLGLVVWALLQRDWRAAAGALAALAAFAWRERRRPVPAVDLSLLTRPGFLGVGLIAVFLSVAYWAVLVHLPLHLADGLGLDARLSGFALLAASLPMLLLPAAGVALLGRLGPRRFLALGLGIGVVGNAVLALAGSLILPALLGMLLAGCGVGLINAQLSGLLIAAAPPDRSGMAAAMGILMRQSGFAVGIALLGAVAGAAGPAAMFLAAGLAGLAGIAVALTLVSAR